jgi:hypothetical protein
MPRAPRRRQTQLNECIYLLVLHFSKAAARCFEGCIAAKLSTFMLVYVFSLILLDHQARIIEESKVAHPLECSRAAEEC